ncbi:MAG: hypothetical protein U1E81_15470 [Xanthobacteraceae bacterium]
MLTLLKKPQLPQPVVQELEKHGVDTVRGLLTNSTDGHSGTGRKVQIDLGNGVKVTRGDIRDWLHWKATCDALWVKGWCDSRGFGRDFSLLALFKK